MHRRKIKEDFMTLNEYQDEARKTAVFKTDQDSLSAVSLA